MSEPLPFNSGKVPGERADANTPSLDYKQMEQWRKLPCALVGGTPAMRDGKATWTPKLKDETDAELKQRLAHHYLVDFYDAAVTDLVDRMFSQGIVLSDDTPQEILDLWSNIDGQGRSGEKFFYDVVLDAGRYGLSEVQADHTPLPQDEDGNVRELTEAEEAALQRRPFLIHRKAKAVIAVDPTSGDGAPLIEDARMREVETERDGFEQVQHEQVRELIRGVDGEPSTFKIYRKDNRDEWKEFATGTNTPPNNAPPEVREAFREVFLTPFYMGFERFHFAKPQWLKAAMLCLEHWQIKGDIRWIEHLANTPTVVHKGEEPLKINIIGSRKVAEIGLDESLEWLVINPNGIAESKKSLEKLEEHLRMELRQPAVHRATGKDLVGVRQLDESRPMTRAQMWAMGMAQSITQSLQQLAYWRGLPSGGTAEFPKDALQQLVDPAGFEDVLKMAQARLLSKKAVQEEAIRYNKLDEEHDPVADLLLLEAEAPELPVFDVEDGEGDD